MRPGLLTVEGLACFRDKQEIDLGALDLFAISGPTGAGKSTLLDAMTFALYGEVPRVTTHDRAEMISASRDRVSVVLDFEVGADRYRIARTLRRSGGHHARLEKHDGRDFTVNLADQVRTVSEKVVEILGLDATTFMQAVLLPQGEFAKFLQAAPRDRRNMLRSLLRLDVYERMRDQAQRTASSKKSSVDSLRKVLAEEYAGVDDNALANLEACNEKLSEDLKVLRKKRDAAQQSLAALRIKHDQTAELQQAERKQKALQDLADEIGRVRAQLDAARRAAPLLSLLDEVTRAATAADAAMKQLESAKIEDNEARAECDAKSIALEAAEKAAEAIPGLRTRIAQLNQIVGRLPEAKQLKKAIARQSAGIEEIATDLAKLESAISMAQVMQAEQSAAIKVAQESLSLSGYDADLDALVETVRTRAVELGINRRSNAEAKEAVAKKQKVLDELQAGLVSLKESAQLAACAFEEVRSRVQDTDAALRKAHQLDAANDLRRALEPNGSCPVCEQTVASPPPADLNPEVAAAEKAVAAAKKLLGEAEAKARSAQESLTHAQANVAAEQETLKSLADHCSELEAKVTKEDNELRAKLAAHKPGDAALVEGWVETTVALLAESRRTHEQAKRQLEVAERAAEKAKSDETSARERLGEKQTARSRLEEDRRSSQERLTKLQEEIAAVSKSEDPGAEAAVVGKQVEALERALKASSAEAANAKNRMTTATEALRLITVAANKALEDATTRGKRRDEEVARAGFPDESVVRSALLDEDTIADLTERVRTHDQECHAVGQRIQALNEALGDFRISDEEMAAAEKAAKDLNGEVEKQHGEQKTLEERVGRMRQRLERSKRMRAELEKEEQALRIYNQLAGDLRSDKFQAYVLEEAFIELVQGASVRLMSLTGERYSLLFRDGDILVVDNDNAGETRISATLSGGETFLTSLSLALELSDQVQRAAGAVHLDSLFIDEGFGTLDPDTLALVSDTIQSLRVGGRVVGIITHIPELRDEFAQQIIVTKHQGFSTVEVRGLVAAA